LNPANQVTSSVGMPYVKQPHAFEKQPMWNVIPAGFLKMCACCPLTAVVYSAVVITFLQYLQRMGSFSFSVSPSCDIFKETASICSSEECLKIRGKPVCNGCVSLHVSIVMFRILLMHICHSGSVLFPEPTG
jgi:hypothetical protein